ncbi:Multidrug resistance protein stp [Actinomadura rubteroloni]|uniref:Multidrug resistance protein stp n=1 Tax=Actinomadura rubteroloni TaxID=1926885 RepID=A0A2P4UQZ6_9ACTN|nr:MFS transporter [Actinomadura rubteroloni]POM27479.1 Multidrug resistance protein stp [Actinomadura rubteroloni]
MARTGTLPTVLTGVFVTVLDFFIVNVALPSLQHDLGAGASAVEWVVAGYGLVYGSGLVLGGRLGDVLGRRRTFALGLALFTVTSALCGLAPDAGTLIAARVAQGAAAALLTPQVLAILRTAYSGRAQARVINAYALTVGLAAVFGQLIGGLLIDADLFGLGWRACFLINVPIGLVTLAATFRVVPESRAVLPGQPTPAVPSDRLTPAVSSDRPTPAGLPGRPAPTGLPGKPARSGLPGQTAPTGLPDQPTRAGLPGRPTRSGFPGLTGVRTRLDPGGAVLVTLALAAVLLPLIEGREQGWPLWTWLSPLAALVLFAVYARRRHPAPLIDPALFRERPFTVGLLTMVAFSMSMSAYFLVFALYVQQGRGLDALHAGLVFAPIGAGYLGASLLAPRLSARFGRQTIALGGLVRAGGLAGLLVLAGVDAPIGALVPALVVDGIGMGLAFAPITAVVLARVAPHHAGSAAGALATAQQVGGALGVGIIGVIYFGAVSGGVAHAFQEGLVYLIAGSLAITALVQFLPRASAAPAVPAPARPAAHHA